MDTNDRANTAATLADKYLELSKLESQPEIKRFLEIADKLAEAKALVKEGKTLKPTVKANLKQQKALRKEISKLTKQLCSPRKPRKGKDSDAGKPTTSESQEEVMPSELAAQNKTGETTWPLRESPVTEPEPTESTGEPSTKPSEPTTVPKKGKKGKRGRPSKKSKDTDAGKPQLSESKTPTLAELKAKGQASAQCIVCGKLLSDCTCPK